MFRLSNLVTALFGIIAALGTLLGIGSLGNVNKTATTSGDPLTTEQPSPDSNPNAVTSQAPSKPLTVQESIAQLAARQVPQNATNSDGSATPAVTTEASTTRTAGQNPSEPFVVQGEGAVLSVEPAAPSTPSEATAVQLDPSPGVATAPPTASPQPAVAQVTPAERTVPAPAPAPPVRAMW